MRSVARSLFVGSPRVSVNQGSRYHRVVINRCNEWAGGKSFGERALATGSAVVTAVRQDTGGCVRGFVEALSGAVEVTRDDLHTAIEVMFEQLYRAFDVTIFGGQ